MHPPPLTMNRSPAATVKFLVSYSMSMHNIYDMDLNKSSFHLTKQYDIFYINPYIPI